MGKTMKYRTTLNKFGLCFQEMKRLNQLVRNEASSEQIKTMIFEENILQQKSFDMQKRIWKEMQIRLTRMDESLSLLIANESTQSAKALVLYNILQVDLLFLDFMRAIYLDKVVTFHQEITKSETARFIEIQIQKDEKAKKWSATTVQKLGATYLRILVEAGMLNQKFQIQRVILSPETEKYLREQGFRPAAEVILGEML
ncbi:DUF1819 family protein [Jeotgalibaca porci]|uniref:DUF1819 family protein n=1 Tax=Jeotgalibaca porci TaxID=1868793 RepID=UPI0035A18FC1